MFISVLNLHPCLSQDMIFFKDGSVKVVKIKSVGDSVISYKIFEVVNSPLYEIQKSDVLSIVHKYGEKEVYNSKSDSVKTSKYDVSNSSTIYILYDFRMDEGNKFPLYFNDTYIYTLNNHSRLKYTMHSGGQLQIRRKGTNDYFKGPVISLSVEPGKSYGVNLMSMYPQALDPNKKFKYDVIVDSTELNQFIKTQFYGFKPFKADDHVFEEDGNSPLFH